MELEINNENNFLSSTDLNLRYYFFKKFIRKQKKINKYKQEAYGLIFLNLFKIFNKFKFFYLNFNFFFFNFFFLLNNYLSCNNELFIETVKKQKTYINYTFLFNNSFNFKFLEDKIIFKDFKNSFYSTDDIIKIKKNKFYFLYNKQVFKRIKLLYLLNFLIFLSLNKICFLLSVNH